MRLITRELNNKRHTHRSVLSVQSLVLEQEVLGGPPAPVHVTAVHNYARLRRRFEQIGVARRYFELDVLDHGVLAILERRLVVG